MARNTANSFGQPSLEDLTVRFLAARSDAALAAVEPSESEVEPHEIAAGFRVTRGRPGQTPRPESQPPRSPFLPTGPRSSITCSGVRRGRPLGTSPSVRDLQPLLLAASIRHSYDPPQPNHLYPA